MGRGYGCMGVGRSNVIEGGRVRLGRGLEWRSVATGFLIVQMILTIMMIVIMRVIIMEAEYFKVTKLKLLHILAITNQGV